MLTLNQYEGIIFPGHEYFEGFPRVLYQAIILKRKFICTQPLILLMILCGMRVLIFMIKN